MKYIISVILLGLAAIGFFLFYQSRVPQLQSDMPSPVMEDPHAGMPAGAVAGKVVETMDAGGYTYVCVDTGHEKVWAAGPLTKVETGDAVSFVKGMEMHDFTSETLDRTFDTIYFVTAINMGGTASMAPDHHGRLNESAPDMDYSGIEVPSGGMRIAAIYEDKTQLAGKEIVVSGKVVKFTPAVMDKNWIHMRDGSGEEGMNDLTVTTDATVAVGQLIIIKGTLLLDKDFGFGYSYPVIVENATVTTEQ